MNRFLLVVTLATLMAGCGSSVKLDDVAVEDRTGTAVAGQSSGTQGGTVGATAGSGSAGITNSAIAPVAIGGAASAVAPPTGSRLVYFDYDSYVVKPEFQDVIENHARFLKADRNRKVSIEGHTDERGGREYNLALGQKRSEAVRRALGLLGVPDGQIEAVSFGKEKPAVQGSDEAALARNRRAEIAYR
ncbi:MAG: peptidoglycan-associated lipoprotein Pal [Burkholderiaceae bacterium]